MLDGGARYDKPVKLLVPDLGEGAIERFHVLGGGIPSLMLGHSDQVKIDLKRGRTDQPCELCLGLDLLWHQIEKPDAQRPDILPRGGAFVHDHHTFARQNVECGQVGR